MLLEVSPELGVAELRRGLGVLLERHEQLRARYRREADGSWVQEVPAEVPEVWLEEREHYVLAAGDCLYFPSTLPHRWHNPGPEPAELVWVNTPPTF